jgi:hypothetical protein
MKRILALLPVLLAFQVCVSPALAWTWPVSGPVLRPFAFDRGNPYAGGQHRGADIGASVGANVVAPAGGTITFAGSTPGGGLTIAIRTADGYSATLVHLGSLAVGRGAAVQGGAVVGTVGSTGQAELGAPHVHLGARIASDEHGYVDPLAFLRGRPPSPPVEPAAGSAAPKSGGKAASADGSAKTATAGEKRAAPEPRAKGRAKRERRPAVHALTPRAPRKEAAVTESVGARRNAPALAERSRRQAGPTGAYAAAASASAPAAWGHPSAETWALLVVLFGAGVLAAGLRRQVRDAVAAHGAPAVFAQAVSSAAEHAGRLRPGQHDHVVMDRDLERVLLAEAHALPDLDRNHDATEVVDVANDACGLLVGPRRGGPQRCSRSHSRGRTPLSARSLR